MSGASGSGRRQPPAGLRSRRRRGGPEPAAAGSAAVQSEPATSPLPTPAPTGETAGSSDRAIDLDAAPTGPLRGGATAPDGSAPRAAQPAHIDLDATTTLISPVSVPGEPERVAATSAYRGAVASGPSGMSRGASPIGGIPPVGVPTVTAASVPGAADRTTGPIAAPAGATPSSEDPGWVAQPPPPVAGGPSPPHHPRDQPRDPAPPRSAGASAAPRRAKLALRKVDPRSVFFTALMTSMFLALSSLAAMAVLFALLDSQGIIASVNDLAGELTRDADAGAAEPAPLLTVSRLLGATALLGVLNVVLVTLLSTVAAALYNVIASFTGGIDVTLSERD